MSKSTPATSKSTPAASKSTPGRSSTETLIKVLRILAAALNTGDGVAEAALLEAAERLQELDAKLKDLNTRGQS
jgi:hypothetical protein